jgi:hypothetical protein
VLVPLAYQDQYTEQGNAYSAQYAKEGTTYNPQYANQGTAYTGKYQDTPATYTPNYQEPMIDDEGIEKNTQYTRKYPPITAETDI